MKIQKTIQNKLTKAKDAVKNVTKQEVGLALAIGIPTAGCIIMGSELISREIIAKGLWARLNNGEVLDRVLENGATIVIKVVQAGEEVCACESH